MTGERVPSPSRPKMVSMCVELEGSTDVYRVSTTAFVLTLRTDARRWGGSILRLSVCVRFLRGSIFDAYSLACKMMFRKHPVSMDVGRFVQVSRLPQSGQRDNREMPPHLFRFALLFEVPCGGIWRIETSNSPSHSGLCSRRS